MQHLTKKVYAGGRHGLMDRALPRCPGGPGSNPVYSESFSANSWKLQSIADNEKYVEA